MKITRNMVNKILNDPYVKVNIIYRYFNGNVPMVMIKTQQMQFRFE